MLSKQYQRQVQWKKIHMRAEVVNQNVHMWTGQLDKEPKLHEADGSCKFR